MLQVIKVSSVTAKNKSLAYRNVKLYDLQAKIDFIKMKTHRGV